MGFCKSCEKHCECADCVLNANYAVNTPKPCPVDCDICSCHDMAVAFCNQHLTISEVNKMIGG